MADNKLTTEIAIDKYDLEKNWFERIAPKYLDVDNLNHLKVGLYGYINEVMATSIRYATAHRNFLYDESFLNTASLTKSIYNKAKSYNYEIPMAKPASMDVSFTITQKDIMTYGTKVLEGGNYTYSLILNADDKYYCGKIPFMAENDIVIKATKMVDGTFSYTAQYDRSKSKDKKGLFSGSTNPYIPIWVERATITNDTDVITIKFTLYQVTKVEKVFENFSSDLSDNLYFEQNFTNNLANFTVRYKTQLVDTYLNSYFNDTFTPEDSYYCYYNFSNNELTIFFSGLPGNFKPTINSKLYLDIYTTLGSAGNFNYTGDITHVFSNENLNRFILNRVVIKLNNPSGGTNMPTRGEVKQALIYEFLTRDNLITEFDLNTYFNNIVNDQIINSSKMVFIKKRDDILKRTYVGYALLRDQTGLIIPTNTIDLECDKFNINEEFHIPSGSLINYSNGKYTLLDDEISLNDGNLKYYEGVPTYFRNDDFIFMEAIDRVSNNLENMLFSDKIRKYILYKNLETMLPSHIRFRNHYLRFEKANATSRANLLEDSNSTRISIIGNDTDLNIDDAISISISEHEVDTEIPVSSKLESSITDFDFIDYSLTKYIRLTNEIAKKLEVNIKNAFPENPLFIIYTFQDSGKYIVPYNAQESRNEYIRYEIAEACGFEDIRDLSLPNKVSCYPPEGGSEGKDEVFYVKVNDILLRDRLGITDYNVIHLVQLDDGYFYIPFIDYDNRLFSKVYENNTKSNEILFNFYYYEDSNLYLTYNEELKDFLNAYNFKEIPVYNFDLHRDPITKQFKNYIISESPINGKYYKKYETALDANYLYKKLYIWFKDQDFKYLINTIGGYKTESGDQDELYISYDYSPTRILLRYKETYDENYFSNRNNLTEVAFRDRDDVIFIDKTTNCILMKNETFIKKQLVDLAFYTDEVKYIGVAYNKESKSESNNPADYLWYLVQKNAGVESLSSTAEQKLYNWIKYATNSNGDDMFDEVTGNENGEELVTYEYTSVDDNTQEITDYYVVYDESDNRMKSAVGDDETKLINFVPYELPKYVELTPYLKDLLEHDIIKYDPDTDVFTLSDGKQYVAYKEDFQFYKNTYRSKSSRLFGAFTWYLKFDKYVEDTLAAAYDELNESTHVFNINTEYKKNGGDLVQLRIDGKNVKALLYNVRYDEVLDPEKYTLYYYFRYNAKDPNRPDNFLEKFISVDEQGKLVTNGRYDNWVRINDTYTDKYSEEEIDPIYIRFDSSTTNYEMYVFYNETGFLKDEDFNVLTNQLINENSLVYRIPYALHYCKEPYPRLLTIQNTLDKNLYFNYSEINGNIPSEFILNNINIKRSSITYDRLVSDNLIKDEETGINKRNTIMNNGFIETTVEMEYDAKSGELLDKYVKHDPNGKAFAVPNYSYKVVNDINKYFLSFNLNTTLFANIRSTMRDIKAYENGVKIYYFVNDGEYYDYCKQKNVLIVRCLLKDTDGKYIGYFDFENESFANLDYNYTFMTDNNLDGNKLNLINCIRNLDPDAIDSNGNKIGVGTLLDSIYIPEQVILELCFLVKVLRDEEGRPYYSDSICLNQPLDLITDVDSNGEILEYSCAVRMEANTPFYFFKIMSDIVNPILDIESDPNKMMIKELPVIGKHYLYNYTVFKDFFNTFGVYYDLLKDSFDKLENNTSVNLKFYNTYGPSRYFQNRNGNDINTNINMKLAITLYDTYTQELDFKIKNFILDFVERINESSANTFAISNLIRELEKNFEDIAYIEFEQLNDQEIKSDGNQVILYNYPSIKDMTKEQLINYVPEYLNVHVFKEAYLQGSENFQVGIEITYK